MIDILSLIQEHLVDLTPYSSARDEYKDKAGTFLDANENPYAMLDNESYNRYPDPYQQEVKLQISKIKKVSQNQIFLGNGSDEAIDLIIRLLCTPSRDKILVMPPTYGMYEVSAQINNNQIVKVNLNNDFQINVPEVLSKIDLKTKIIFICNPNNPTGNLLRRTDIIQILERFDGIVIVDEAYIDFVEEQSMLSVLKDYNNLVILHTLSKAWGLAGIRLGIAFGDPLIIEYLNKIKPPYNINSASQKLALKALKNVEKKDNLVKQIIKSKNKIISELNKLDITVKVFDTSANFILVKFRNADAVFDFLLSNKVIVRNRSNVILCDDSLRITVGLPEENKLLIDTLKKLK